MSRQVGDYIRSKVLPFSVILRIDFIDNKAGIVTYFATTVHCDCGFNVCPHLGRVWKINNIDDLPTVSNLELLALEVDNILPILPVRQTSHQFTNIQHLRVFRAQLDNAFSKTTAHPLADYNCKSAGHCAVVSKLLYDWYGADMVSAIVNGNSHWFNRVLIGGDTCDVDLTGDQFGFDSVQVAAPGRLYPNTRLRKNEEICSETMSRYNIFVNRLISIKS